MERTIGNLVGEIRQPSNPYANLAQRAIHRAQHNSLMVMIPTLDPDYGQPLFPRWSKDLGNRALLRDSSDTFYSCMHRGEVGLRVVRVPSIQSVVAMVPHTLAGEERFYMFEKPGMDLANLGGILWDEDDVDDEDNQPT
jgi:hypothetical protein